jgi:hypothetical protein
MFSMHFKGETVLATGVTCKWSYLAVSTLLGKAVSDARAS